jgi:hypothetical protein
MSTHEFSYLERRERHHVHAHVVVLEVRAGLVQLPLRPVVRGVAHGPIRPVRLAPERPLPVARLPQQMIPLDLLVVRRLEEIDVRRHVVARVVVDVVNQPALHRKADDGS